MDGCSSSQNPPKGDSSGAFTPRNKSTDSEGRGYDSNGKKFSIGGLLNASKDTFAGGARPEAQAFQGVWNYIANNNNEDNWNPFVESYHFHTTPDKTLTDSTHYDIRAYTIDHGGKVLEITWQMPNATDTSSTDNSGNKHEKLKNHTRRFTLNQDGTVTFTDVYMDGR